MSNAPRVMVPTVDEVEVTPRQPEPMGAYVHFPWCLSKCPYCDFVSFAEEPQRLEHRRYADAVLAELALRSERLAGRTLATVFFGGGTPSLWAPEELGRVLAGIVAAADFVAPDLEVTVECNPSSLPAERATALVHAGVGRLSVGVQSLDAARLRFLGRWHDPSEARAAVRGALASGARVSADLIHAVATEEGPPSPAEAAREALEAVDLGVEHVSSYGLTVEPSTRFGELARAGRLPMASDEASAASFLAVSEALTGAGFEHYEISNYARPGKRSRHNVAYWQGRDYLGLGCAAVGTVREPDGTALRTRNTTSPASYLGAVLGGSLRQTTEVLTAEVRLQERLMLGLRLREGFDLVAAAEELGVEAWPSSRRRAADLLIAQGRLVEDRGRLCIPSPAAWLLADDTCARLL